MSDFNCKDLSHIIYFNCDQQGYWITKCPKLRKKYHNLLLVNSIGWFSIKVVMKIAIADFLFQDKLEKIRLFKKTFLLIDTSMEIVLIILFFIFSNIYIWFVEKELI